MRNKLTLKLNNNIFLVLFLFFIPFANALTFRIGFPLKLSEISLFILLFLYLLKGKFYFENSLKSVLQVIGAFCLFAAFSTVVNLFWSYPYALNTYISRFGYAFDSILKLAYLIIAFFAFIVSLKAYQQYPQKFIRIFLTGAILASTYSWYLFLAGLLHLPVFLLPGMDPEPQAVALSFGTFIRCGTFKEGNYMGLFLLIAAAVALHINKKKTCYFLLATVITTVSSMAIISSVIFLMLYNAKTLFSKRNLHKLLLFIAVVVISFIVLLGHKDFRVIVLSKFFGSTENISNNAEYSKADRLNTTLTAFQMGLHNPVIGVGLSNYALHTKQYNVDKRFLPQEVKTIPNNIYGEIFSELGLIGLALFLLFLHKIYGIIIKVNSPALKYSFWCTLFYFAAFPTYTILFIWVYWGLIAGLSSTTPDSESII